MDFNLAREVPPARRCLRKDSRGSVSTVVLKIWGGCPWWSGLLDLWLLERPLVLNCRVGIATLPGLENAMILFTTTLDPVGITTMLCFYRRLGLRCDEEGEILVKGLPCDLMCIHTHTHPKNRSHRHTSWLRRRPRRRRTAPGHQGKSQCSLLVVWGSEVYCDRKTCISCWIAICQEKPQDRAVFQWPLSAMLCLYILINTKGVEGELAVSLGGSPVEKLLTLPSSYTSDQQNHKLKHTWIIDCHKV